jgi:hypothetical protein
MARLFHDQAGRRNRVHDLFDRGDGSGFEVGPFHDCGVHPPHPVQLMIRSSSRVEQSRLFQEANRRFHSGKGRTSLREDAVAGGDRISQTRGLRRRHTPGTGASVGKNERTGAGQLRRRFRACRYVGSFMRSRSDRTNPSPVTQSSKLSESLRNRGSSSFDGPSAIRATIP